MKYIKLYEELFKKDKRFINFLKKIKGIKHIHINTDDIKHNEDKLHYY